jgi:ElaB/YqjD/DUF883 family membrane-anchored ribosome-binding protein
MDERLTGEMGTALDKAREQLSGAARVAMEKAEELSRQAASKADAARGPAAEKLENAAAALHQTADNLPGGPRVQGAAHAAAGRLADAAGYVRTHNVRDAAADVDRTVRRYPGQALLAALCVGFVAGRLLRPSQS